MLAHAPYLIQWAKSQLPHHDAEDVVQDALAAACRALPSFEGRSSIKTWLTAILRRKIIDHLRRQRPTELFEESFHSRESKEPDPAQSLQLKERWAEVAQSLDELPDLQRKVFVSREIEGQPTNDICATYGISPGNLWVMVHRARNRLRQQDRPSTLRSAA